MPARVWLRGGSRACVCPARVTGAVEDEGAVLALLDEALISCQERCLDAVAVEHAKLEELCQEKRRQLERTVL